VSPCDLGGRVRHFQGDRCRTRIGSFWIVLRPRGVAQDGDLLSMDFPALPIIPCPDPPVALLDGVGMAPKDVFRVDSGRNYFAIYASKGEVRAIRPNLSRLE